jgi:chromosome segregation ATPase
MTSLNSAQSPKQIAKDVAEQIAHGKTMEDCSDVQEVIENLVMERDEVHQVKNTLSEVQDTLSSMTDRIEEGIKAGQDGFESFKVAFKKQKSYIEKLESQIGQVDERRKSDRRISDDRHAQVKAELDILKHTANNTAQAAMQSATSASKTQDSVLALTSSISSQFSSLHDSINILTASALEGGKPQKTKPSKAPAKITEKIPVAVWPVIVVALVGALVFLATGDDSLLKLIGLGGAKDGN